MTRGLRAGEKFCGGGGPKTGGGATLEGPLRFEGGHPLAGGRARAGVEAGGARVEALAILARRWHVVASHRPRCAVTTRHWLVLTASV